MRAVGTIFLMFVYFLVLVFGFSIKRISIAYFQNASKHSRNSEEKSCSYSLAAQWVLVLCKGRLSLCSHNILYYTVRLLYKVLVG